MNPFDDDYEIEDTSWIGRYRRREKPENLDDYDTYDIFEALDALDAMRPSISDRDSFKPPKLRDDLLELHSTAFKIVREGYTDKKLHEEMWELVEELEAEAFDIYQNAESCTSFSRTCSACSRPTKRSGATTTRNEAPLALEPHRCENLLQRPAGRRPPLELHGQKASQHGGSGVAKNLPRRTSEIANVPGPPSASKQRGRNLLVSASTVAAPAILSRQDVARGIGGA